MLYAYPHDLAAYGEELSAIQRGVGAPGPVEALHLIIDRRLAAPMIHELSHGGRAEVRTAPGEGTEVRLAMPRQSRESQSQEEMS